MPSDSRNLPEQEISIKSRAHEVFSKARPEDGRPPTKPFPFYLRETPASPMSSPVKATLCFAAIIVGLLFLAAVWKFTVRYGPKRVAPARPARVNQAVFPLGGRSARFTDAREPGPNAYDPRGAPTPGVEFHVPPSSAL
jgi:hypothetical protein